jgi:hypothetical protein
MTCARHQDSIGELIDGTLAGPDREALETHLATCEACRARVEDLRRIREAAARLDRLQPPDRVWTQIAARLEFDAPGRKTMVPSFRRSAALSWLAAAALVVILAGTVWFMRSAFDTAPQHTAGIEGPAPSIEADRVAGNDSSPVVVESIEEELRLAEEHYMRAITALEQIANEKSEVLDPEVAGTLQRNLQVIDQAIAESRAAVQVRPESRPAQESLFEALRRKVYLLQDTIALMNEMRKGNQSEAARIVEGLNKS